MPDKVTISHRGAKYEIGRGKRFYGIWVTGAPQDAPVDRWPETPEGWAQAWSRFAAIETPGTISAVERPGFTFPRLRLGRGSAPDAGPARFSARRSAITRVAAITVLALGVIVGAAGLFPEYFAGQSVTADQVTAHVCYLVAWAVSAILLAFGGRKARAGAVLGLGLSAVTLGMFWSDLGYVVAGQAELGAGLALGVAGWVLCTAGAAAGLAIGGKAPAPGQPAEPGQAAEPGETVEPGEAVEPGRPTEPLGGPVRPRARHAGALALLGLSALGTAIAFAPAWDSVTLAAQGGSQSFTQGDAFQEPGVILAGTVLVMAALIAVAVTAALWRPARHGAAFLAGAIVPMAAQAISALIQVSEPASPSTYGISQSQAAAAGLTITTGVTPVFWVYCVFVIALVISCAWLLTEPAQPAGVASVSDVAGNVRPEPGDTEGNTENSFA